jgi:putative DNA-invertase from lambdoid prophage Rac
MTRAAIWARVSTGDQESANQLRDLRDWAARRGFEVAIEYILDDNSASKGEQQAHLDQALMDARIGRFDVLLCWALDRMERRGVEQTLALMRRFREQGVLVWSLKESWTETSDPRMAELLTSLFAWMAAEESRRRSERVKAGMARAKAEGKTVGGRKAGAKDKRPRKRDGYVAEGARRKAAAA